MVASTFQLPFLKRETSLNVHYSQTLFHNNIICHIQKFKVKKRLELEALGYYVALIIFYGYLVAFGFFAIFELGFLIG